MSGAIRPTWDATFLALAATLAKRATCLRGQFGAVYVDADHQVLASGFNGAPRGMNHCTDPRPDLITLEGRLRLGESMIGCLMESGHCVRSVHAEMNGIIQAARTGVSLAGSRLYVTGRPCRRCCVAIVQVGVVEVIYPMLQAYHTDSEGEALSVLRGGGVKVRTVEAA